MGKLYCKDGWVNWKYILDQGCAFTEAAAKESGIYVDLGYELIQKLIGG